MYILKNSFLYKFIIKIVEPFATAYNNSILKRVLNYISFLFAHSIFGRFARSFVSKKPVAMYNSSIYKLFDKFQMLLLKIAAKMDLENIIKNSLFFKLVFFIRSQTLSVLKNNSGKAAVFLLSFAFGYEIFSLITKSATSTSIIVACGLVFLGILAIIIKKEYFANSMLAKLLKIIFS